MVYSLSRWHKTLEQNQLFLQWEILKLCGCLSIGCKWNALAKPVGSSWAINHGLCNQISFHSFNYFSFLLDRIQIFDFFFRFVSWSGFVCFHILLSLSYIGFYQELLWCLGLLHSSIIQHPPNLWRYTPVNNRVNISVWNCEKTEVISRSLVKKKSSTDSAVAFDHLHGFSYVYTIYDIHGFLCLKNYLSLKVRSHMRYTFWKIGHFLLEAYILGAENKIDNQ